MLEKYVQYQLINLSDIGSSITGSFVVSNLPGPNSPGPDLQGPNLPGPNLPEHQKVWAPICRQISEGPDSPGPFCLKPMATWLYGLRRNVFGEWREVDTLDLRCKKSLSQLAKTSNSNKSQGLTRSKCKLSRIDKVFIKTKSYHYFVLSARH